MENKKCPICGKEMITKIDGSALNYDCPNCGYGEATTIAEGIEWDCQEYSIFIEKMDDVKIKQIKCVAKNTGLNYIQSKKMLLEGGLYIKDKAIIIKQRLEELKKIKIKYIISPDFPY